MIIQEPKFQYFYSQGVVEIEFLLTLKSSLICKDSPGCPIHPLPGPPPAPPCATTTLSPTTSKLPKNFLDPLSSI